MKDRCENGSCGGARPIHAGQMDRNTGCSEYCPELAPVWRSGCGRQQKWPRKSGEAPAGTECCSVRQVIQIPLVCCSPRSFVLLDNKTTCARGNPTFQLKDLRCIVGEGPEDKQVCIKLKLIFQKYAGEYIHFRMRLLQTNSGQYVFRLNLIETGRFSAKNPFL